MNIIYQKLTPERLPRQFIEQWIKQCLQLLKREARGQKGLSPRLKKALKPWGAKSTELVVVWISAPKMRALNAQFRGKNHVTDILSFAAESPCIGELVLCPQKLLSQAKDHELSFREELAYLLLHGLLHLLGFDHQSARQEREMMELQNRLFDLGLYRR